MVIIRATPDAGVPPIPYSVSPVTLSAKSLTLVANVVVFVMQLTLTFVTFAPAMVPLPLVTVQVCVAGWVNTVTL